MEKSTRFGRYDLLELIAKGGMAEVFKARAREDVGFERIVAVKRILPQLAQDNDFISMFIDEAKIAVQLNHASIAQIYDLGCVDEHYYIALEYVHGRDLRCLTQREKARGGTVPIEVACFVVSKVAEALDFAHRAVGRDGKPLKVIHRDVSPQNVIVSFEGDVKVIDFGLAKAAGRTAETRAGMLKGKLAYLSPEQALGNTIDWRSDIYALGILLFELLTGHRLFLRDNDIATIMAVRAGTVPNPRSLAPDINAHLAAIVLKALARDRRERYQRALELGEDLEAYLYSAGQPYNRRKLAKYMNGVFPEAFLEEEELEELLGLELVEDSGLLEDDEALEDEGLVEDHELLEEEELSAGDLVRVASHPTSRGSGSSVPAESSTSQAPSDPGLDATDVFEDDDDDEGPEDMTAVFVNSADGIRRSKLAPSSLLEPDAEETIRSSVPKTALPKGVQASPLPAPQKTPAESRFGASRASDIATIEASLSEHEDLVTAAGLAPVVLPKGEPDATGAMAAEDTRAGVVVDPDDGHTSETDRPEALEAADLDPDHVDVDPHEEPTVVNRSTGDTIPAPSVEDAGTIAQRLRTSGEQSVGELDFDDETEGTQITEWSDDATRPIDTAPLDAPKSKTDPGRGRK